MKQRFFLLTLACLAAFSFQGYSSDKKVKTNVQKYINTQLKTDSLFKNAVVGILAINSKGEIIGEWNSNFPLLTASTMKTITTGIGLYYLGTDYKFSTRIAYNGTISNGTLDGDIIIEGGGDPTLGSRDTLAYPIDSIFGIWSSAITDAGIKEINGDIIVDDSYFKREGIPDTWTWSNIGPSYGSAPSGLSFCENIQYFKLQPGANIGDTAKVTLKYPMLPDLKLVNEVITDKENSGDWSTYYVQDMAQISRYNGTIPINRDSIIADNSNRFPQISCGYEFLNYLNNNGVEVAGGIKDFADFKTSEKNSINRNYLAETFSPELWRIVNVTNRISNNFFAETILKTIGKKQDGIGGYYGAIDAIREILSDSLHLDLQGYQNQDGSGLSREDFVTPSFFCNYYSTIEKTAIFEKFFNSLPVSGGPGTLKTVLKDEDPALRCRIHAKSGSLSGVRCYAGYVEEPVKDGEPKQLIKFAIQVNNYPAPTSKMQPKIELFLKSLAEYGLSN